MKRIFLHGAFWFAYLVQGVVLVYLWDKSFLSNLTVAKQLMLAIANCSISLIPKMLFAYCFIYYILPELIRGRAKRQRMIIILILALMTDLLLYRAITVYFIFPVIYQGLFGIPPYFAVTGFLEMLIDVGYASGAATVIKQIRQQLANKEREKNLIKEKLETELKFLRNQTNPHFLFNTLNNIYALARKKSDETADVVMKLSKLLRVMLYESKNERIPISDEMKILDDYIELEKLRYDERLMVSFLREIDNDHEQIAPLLLIAFVENAFKHGVSESRFESFIHLEMKVQGGILEFFIENTYEPNGKKNNDENIGLTNVRRQLELLYKEHEVCVQNQGGIFKVSLKINLESYANI